MTPRVVSLVPSVTETLLEWAVTPVAVTRFCEHPELPAVGGTKDPDIARIVDLAPDLVAVNDEENREEDAAALRAAGIPLHNVRVRDVADVPGALAGLAAAIGVDAPPVTLPVPAGPDAERAAFVPVWRRPWMTMNRDTYGSSVLAVLGITNVFGDAVDRYPTVDLDAARARRPDVVLAPSEPYPFGARHVDELATVAPVVLVDGKDLFWWGSRTPAALTRLSRRLRAG